MKLKNQTNMIITIKEVREQFDKWNKEIFKGSLPVPLFEIVQVKSFLGQFKWRKLFGDNYQYIIRINTYYDRPFEFYVDTIVHEMLHYYIRYNKIRDTSSHGKIWKHMANEISNKYNLNISRTNSIGGGISDVAIEKKKEKKIGKFEYVFLCEMSSGNFGAAVVSSNKVYAYKPRFEAWKAVKNFVVVKAPWSQTYSLRHLKTACGIGYITNKEYAQLHGNKVIAVKGE